MKKINSIILLLACVFMFSRCSDSAYTDKYTDPNKITTVQIDKLFVAVLSTCNDYCIAGYGRYYAGDNGFLAHFSQSFGYGYSNGMYGPNNPSWADKYGSFCSVAAHFKLLEIIYNDMSESDKTKYEGYYLCAKVHTYAFMLAILDTQGDIPWEGMGLVAATGDYSYTNAYFNKAEDLYKLILTDMKEIGTKLGNMTLPFNESQDWINQGNAKKWQIYANSLRLRTAMRVASQGALSADGRAAIAEILGNPSAYPVISNNSENIFVLNLRTGPVNAEGGGGLDDNGAPWAFASGFMLSRMLSDFDRTTWSGVYDNDGTDDPRVPIYWGLATASKQKVTGYPSYTDANGNVIEQAGVEIPEVFRGATPEMSQDDHSAYTTSANGISKVRYNGFFWHNENFDHPIISAAEIGFIKAEAYLNGWASGDPKTAFKEAVALSFDWYFSQHNKKSRADVAIPADGKNYTAWVLNIDLDYWTAEKIDEFAEARWSKQVDGSPYDSQLDAIITQKYIDFGYMYVREAWCEIRRTGYPSGLVFPTTIDSKLPNVPARWEYPSNEINFNKNFLVYADGSKSPLLDDYYASTNNAKKYYQKLFWAK
ncbi:MAG: SusD/RagB family nutrient-binding outer membrane lipoprotein [Tannerella sp.]|nr:SusD/RagB family nutrient-binding outer membrane lipoprotein [Tannerella sp.]